MSFNASNSDLREIYSTPRDIITDMTALLSPPNRGKPSDVANEIMVLPEGTHFDWRLTPYMREPMDLLTSRDFKAIIFCAPARTGKSISLIDALQAYIISNRPSDNLTIFATDAMARRYSRMRFDPLVKNSPELSKWLTLDHNKDNVLNKEFKHGMSSWFGSPTPTNLSASDYRYCFWSDVDRGADDNSDGDIFSQLIKRNATFLSSGMTVCEGSPSRDLLDSTYKQTSEHVAPPVTGTLGLYNSGDRRMFYWKCPHCNDRFKLSCDLELFHLPKERQLLELAKKNGVKQTALSLSFIYCPKCGSQINSKIKRKLNRSGLWVKENEGDDHDIASFWLSGVASAFQPWESILSNYIKALTILEDTGDETRLKAMFNVDLAMPYTPRSISDSLTPEELERRAVGIPKRVVIDSVRYLIATIDVQKRKFVVQVEGWGVGNSRVLIDRFDITMSNRKYGGVQQGLEPPTYLDDWDILLEKVITARYPLVDDSGRDMGVLITACDSGGSQSSTGDGSVTENAYKFWRKMKDLGLKDKFILIKGTRPPPSSNLPAIKRSLLSKQSKTARKAKVTGMLPLWLLNTTLLKDTVMSVLKRVEGEGVINFPQWLPSWFYKEITAETRTDKGWDNFKGRRNEAFDLLCYAHAAHLVLMDAYWKDSIDWEHPPTWAETWDDNVMVSDSIKFAKEKPSKLISRPARTVANHSNKLSGYSDDY